MTARAVVPALVDFTDPLAPRAAGFDDAYHPPHGAFRQAAHVFLGGNGLPDRWRDRPAFAILETGFGLGSNFLATWQAWRADPRRPRRLRFVSIEKHPLRTADLGRALQACPAPDLAAQLLAAWPPLTPDFHLLPFDDGAVELTLVLGDAAASLRQVVGSIDAFYLDGFKPACNPDMWQAGLFRSLSRLAAPGATAATWSAARAVRDGLSLGGFEWRQAEGIGGKRDITLARFAPRVVSRPPVARIAFGSDRDGIPGGTAGGGKEEPGKPGAGEGEGVRPPKARRVAILGGGLAGASCARALAAEGWACLVFDRLAAPAQAASGNAAGLFHGVVHPDDGMHARALRAAALMAERDYRAAIRAGVPGACDGLLRLVPDAVDDLALQRDLAASGLPPDFVQAWAPSRVQAAGGPACPAWFYPGGGWIAPGALVGAWLNADEAIIWHGSRDVATIESIATPSAVSAVPAASAAPPGWRLRDASGVVLAEVDAVVLANGGDALRHWAQAAGAAPPMTMTITRGQVTLVAADTPGLRAPRLPVAGQGYALTLADGAVMCGATSQSGDADPSPRPADHRHNLRQLQAVTGSRVALAPDGEIDPQAVDAGSVAGRITGRVGWRASPPDRLPLVGALPCAWPAERPSAPDQPRHWPRLPGLYIAAGFGSRGLTWAPLLGRLLAAWVTGAPAPVPADLVDALDPARFSTRAVRASRRR